MRKVTLKVEDSLHQALRQKAVDTKQSMSELVNDFLEVYFEEYLSNEIVSDTSNHSKPLEPEPKREILFRLLEESQSIICRDTNAADNQGFLYGEDAMPSCG
jgi:hypothetical protein